MACQGISALLTAYENQMDLENLLDSDYSFKSKGKKVMDGSIPTMNIDALRAKKASFIDKKNEYIHLLITPGLSQASNC